MPTRNYTQSTIDVMADLQLGVFVSRTAAAVAGALTPIFTVYVGAILLTAIWAKMTVVSGANNVHLEATPSTGATIPIAANLDIDLPIVGDYIVAPLTGSGALTYNASATGLVITGRWIIIPIGTIDYHAAAADGTLEWYMTYVPIEAGAYVSAT